MKIPVRIKILAAAFVVLSVAAFFSLQKKLRTDTINKNGTEVAVRDTSSVTRITIQKDGQTQSLVRSGGAWKINDRYHVRTNVMNLLLMGLNQLEIKRPVSQDLESKASELLFKKGTKVSIEYEDQTKTLIFASNENDPNTTFLLPENSKIPYIAYVPGVPGDINNIFKLKEHEWRNRELFTSHPNSIQRLQVTYPGDPAGSFEIFFQGGNLLLKDAGRVDSSKLENYLLQYQFVPVSGYLTGNADSLETLFRQNKPLSTIDLTDINSVRSNAVTLYDTGDKKDYLGKLTKTGEAVTLNREIADRLLVKRSFFMKK